LKEIARVHGLDKFPPRLPAARTGAARLPQYEAESAVARAADWTLDTAKL